MTTPDFLIALGLIAIVGGAALVWLSAHRRSRLLWVIPDDEPTATLMCEVDDTPHRHDPEVYWCCRDRWCCHEGP